MSSKQARTQEVASLTLIWKFLVRGDGASAEAALIGRLKELNFPSLNDTLNDPVLTSSFMTFLRSQFCEENLDFVVAVNSLRKFEAWNVAQVADIYQRFFTAHRLNISHQESEKLRDSMLGIAEGADISKSLFDAAMQEVLSMLVEPHGRFAQGVYDELANNFRTSSPSSNAAITLAATNKSVSMLNLNGSGSNGIANAATSGTGAMAATAVGGGERCHSPPLSPPHRGRKKAEGPLMALGLGNSGEAHINSNNNNNNNNSNANNNNLNSNPNNNNNNNNNNSLANTGNNANNNLINNPNNSNNNNNLINNSNNNNNAATTGTSASNLSNKRWRINPIPGFTDLFGKSNKVPSRKVSPINSPPQSPGSPVVARVQAATSVLAMLDDLVLRKMFRDFLEKEHSAENLLFVEDVIGYRGHARIAAAAAAAAPAAGTSGAAAFESHCNTASTSVASLTSTANDSQTNQLLALILDPDCDEPELSDFDSTETDDLPTHLLISHKLQSRVMAAKSTSNTRALALQIYARHFADHTLSLSHAAREHTTLAVRNLEKNASALPSPALFDLAYHEVLELLQEPHQRWRNSIICNASRSSPPNKQDDRVAQTPQSPPRQPTQQLPPPVLSTPTPTLQHQQPQVQIHPALSPPPVRRSNDTTTLPVRAFSYDTTPKRAMEAGKKYTSHQELLQQALTHKSPEPGIGFAKPLEDMPPAAAAAAAAATTTTTTTAAAAAATTTTVKESSNDQPTPLADQSPSEHQSTLLRPSSPPAKLSSSVGSQPVAITSTSNTKPVRTKGLARSIMSTSAPAALTATLKSMSASSITTTTSSASPSPTTSAATSPASTSPPPATALGREGDTPKGGFKHKTSKSQPPSQARNQKRKSLPGPLHFSVHHS
jgi:hypothetical protein